MLRENPTVPVVGPSLVQSPTVLPSPMRSPVRARAVRRVVSSCIAGCVLLFAGACGGDDPQVPTEFAPTGTISSTAAVASLVGTVPSVRITDQRGRGIRNVQVRWRVTAGGGKVVNDSALTSASGEASSGGWTLGTVAGVQTLQATADGVSAVTFTANAEPGPAARLLIAGGTGQRAMVNAPLAVAPSVRVEDFFGNPVPDVAVTFGVLTGGGTLRDAAVKSDARGIATPGAWTLGTVSGDQLVRATSGTLQEVSFAATAEPGPLAKLVAVSSNVQEGATRAPAPSTPAVRTADEFGNPVGGVPVTFTTGSASGSVTSATVVSDPVTAIATTTWLLGDARQQTLIAVSSALPGQTAGFSASTIDSDFDIDVRFVGSGGTTRQREAFAKAVVRWRRVLTTDLHTSKLNTPAGDCEPWIPALNESVNDLVIYARLAPIDGPGRILGQAGPCYINTSTRLTSLGIMEFDLDDLPGLIANETLDDVVLHEIGHVLGIGTLWNYRRSLLTGRGGSDPYFVGEAARAQFLGNGGAGYGGQPVPVENSGGVGTRDAHWRQSIFGKELMQGYSSRGFSPLSATTVASLSDLGYPGVRMSGSDSFTFGMSAFFDSPAAMVELRNDVADVPLIEVDAGGNRTVVRPRGKR